MTDEIRTTPGRSTPRTEANLRGWEGEVPTPFLEFARQLERELTEMHCKYGSECDASMMAGQQLSALRLQLRDAEERARNTHSESAFNLPKAYGVTVMHDNQRAVLVSFERKLTDDELRALHDLLARRNTPSASREQSAWHPVSEAPVDEDAMFVVRDAEGQCAFAVRYNGEWEHTADADCGPIAQWIALPRAT